VIERFGLRADKRLGQHFLLDPAVLDRIARHAGDLAGRAVLEVGPGPGGLTRALLATEAARVIAVERDPRCLDALQTLLAHAGGRLDLVQGDALALELADLVDGPVVIVANLPYNVATPLLVKWLDTPERVPRMVLMFQREVALRLVAAPGTAAYGRLSVLVQWLAQAQIAMHLPAGAFLPPPKVSSSLVRLEPRPQPLAPAPRAAFERVLKAAFGQRRKMLRASLRTLGCPPGDLCRTAGIAETARAETLSVEDFCRLAQAYAAAGGAGQC